MRRIIFDFSGATTWLPNFLALIKHLADFFAGMKEVRLIRRVIFAARPKRETERRFIPPRDIVGLIKYIADWQVPVLIYVIDKMIYVVGSRLVGMDLPHFHFAGEERHVTAHQFISHLDREVDRTGIRNAFIFGNAIAAATLVGLPPMAGLRLLSRAIKLYPRSHAGHREFRIELAAAGNRTIDAQV